MAHSFPVKPNARFFLRFLYLSLFLSFAAVVCSASSLESGFLNPPASARPWVYWFWLNGNLTSNGITADLEAMQRADIGGVLIMEVDQGRPRARLRSVRQCGASCFSMCAPKLTAWDCKST